ncbi:hypothetical protein [Duganella phyllosphaerae]|uniref:Uncharacterized protein n=1 Tax=Duganella phyllosphaerae TaxID=762836 RepID=A0A1E7WZJ5_9BURK|nr:hypothetical protein [Duganella phyllosphaerae]OFA05193.1 hypothetical protein DUPY_15960 [Duganella phyllosphaerae]
MVVGDMEIRLRAEFARLQQDMDRARQTVAGSMGRIGASVGDAMKMLAGFAAALSVGAFVNFVKGSIDAVDALNDMSVRTKVGIEDLAGLAYGAKLSDTSLEGVASSITKLSQNIGKDGAKFRELGITATEPLEAFKQLADVFKGIQDPQQRAAFGAEALGKSWQEAAVLLDSGSEGIQKLMSEGKELSGITEQVAADAGAFNDKLDELGFAAQGGGTRIAAGLLPTLNQIVESMSSSAVKGDTLKGVVIGLSGALKILYTVGVGVVEVFSTMGRAIGAAAAMTVQVLNGDFAAAWQTYKDVGSDIADGWGDAARRVAIAWGSTTKDVAKDAAESGETVADTGRKVAAFLHSADISASRKKAADEAMGFYKKTRDASIDHLMQLEAEREGQVALSAEEKKRIEILNDLLKFGKNLTEQQRADIEGWAEAIPLLAKYNKELEKTKALREQREGEAYSDVASAREQTQALKDQVKYYGLAEDAVLKLKAAEIQRGLDGGYIDDIERGRLQGLLDATNEQITLQDKLSSMKSESTFWAGLEDTAHQTFLSIANGSKDTATRLKETFKNVFFDWLYQMTVKKWIINVGTATSGTAGVSGIANAAGVPGLGGGTGNSAFDLLSMGKTIYQGFSTGFASVAGSLGTGISSLGAAFGSEAVAAFGAGLQGGALGATTASAASGYGGTVAAGYGAAAAPWVAGAAGIAGGIYGGRLVSGGYSAFGGSGNSAVNTGTAVGAAVGSIVPVIGTAIGALVGGLLGGAANRLFGHKAPKIDSQGIRGSIGLDGISAETYANIVAKGGTFRSDKWSYEKAALDAQTDSALDTTIKAMITSVKGFGKALGVEASAIDSYSKVFDIKLTGDAAKDDELILGLITTVGDELSLKLVPGLAKFALEGEALATTLQRVTANYVAVDTVLGAIGKTVGVVGAAGIEARERLIAAAGGLDALAGGVSFFQANFLTEAEKVAPLQKQVATALADMGKSSIKTSDDFKAAVLGIDVSTDAGAKLFAQMMALAPAFKSVADYAAELAGAVALTEAQIRDQGRDLQQQLAEITRSEAERLAVQRAGIADVNKAYFDQVQAAKAVVSAKDALSSAYGREASAAKDALDLSKAWVTTLNGLNPALAQGNLSTLTPEQKYAEARAQFEKTLAAANSGDTTAQSGLSAAEQAFLTASQVVNASDAKYAADYARVIAANQEAAKWASQQVDLQQASYDALEAQVKSLITINDSVNAGSLTVAQAIVNLQAAMGVTDSMGVKFTNAPAVTAMAVAAAPAMDFSRYQAGSNAGTEVMAAAIKALQEEVKGLRADQVRQTVVLKQSNEKANADAAKTVVQGVEQSAKTTVTKLEFA